MNRLKNLLIAALLAALAGSITLAATGGEAEAGDALGLEGTDLRVNARVVEGRVQFAIQERVSGTDKYGLGTVYDDWRERELPAKNKMPSGDEPTNWLYSSPVEISINGNWGMPAWDARIAARRLADARIEFGLQVRNRAMGQWGSLALPSSRFLPADFDQARWLHSSPLNMASIAPQVPSNVPVNAEGVVRRADLDGYSWNGQEPTLYYGTEVDPLDDGHNTWVVAVAATDDNLYDTLRLQVACYDGSFFISLWESHLPYATDDEYGNKWSSVTYRFDDGEAVTDRWAYSENGNDDSIEPGWGVHADAFERDLRTSNRLVVRARFYSNTVTAIFNGLQGLWSTPVQRNLEYCGR